MCQCAMSNDNICCRQRTVYICHVRRCTASGSAAPASIRLRNESWTRRRGSCTLAVRIYSYTHLHIPRIIQSSYHSWRAVIGPIYSREITKFLSYLLGTTRSATGPDVTRRPTHHSESLATRPSRLPTVHTISGCDFRIRAVLLCIPALYFTK